MKNTAASIMTVLAFLIMIPAAPALRVYADDDGEYLGRYSANPIDSDSTSNPVGEYGSTVSPNSINNSVGPYGSSVSPTSARNPFATDTPKLYSQDGEYLGKLSANQFDPESISNPVGVYGSPCSPKSVNNPVGRYGSTVSPESANNPLATNAPRIYHDRDAH